MFDSPFELTKYALFRKPDIPKEIELFLPTEKNFIYIHNGSIIGSFSEFGLMSEIKEERGSILEAITKFEFIISEMIRITDVGIEPTKPISEVNKTLNFNQRIIILTIVKKLDKELVKNIRSIMDVRNSLAHKLLANETIWKNKPIFETNNFKDFKDNLQKTWDELISEYKKFLSDYDVDSLLKKIKIDEKS